MGSSLEGRDSIAPLVIRIRKSRTSGSEKSLRQHGEIAKAMQARFMCTAHNLLLLFEQKLEKNEGISNEPELQRRARRLEKARQLLAEKGDDLPRWQEKITRMTQRSAKFIR